MMSPTPLVLQLQQLAAENSTGITELLRKTLIVASKLDLRTLRQWVNKELNGYGADEVPAYRHVRAELKARNPYHGLVPFLIDDREIMDKLCNIPLDSPIGSLTDLLEHRRESDSYLIVPFRPSDHLALMQIQGDFYRLEPVRTVGRNQVAAILDAVRTAILDWALQLETDGIVGEGMTFSADEKQRAHASISIENFQGILGNVSESTVTQNLRLTVRRGDLATLRGCLADSGLTTSDIDELEQAINEDPTPESKASFGEGVSGWIGRMVAKAASGGWQIGVGAAGEFLGNAIGSYYGF
jgi:hypothetical protein